MSDSDNSRPHRPPRQAGAPAPGDRSLKSQRELKRLITGEAPPDLSQIKSVVQKLQVVIADYIEGGKAIPITLNPIEILSAIEAAIEEANGSPSPWPDGADARTFFVHGLYDEIIQQPSNIFETRLFPDGSERYVPVSKAVWKACLEKLRQGIVENGLALVKRGKV